MKEWLEISEQLDAQDAEVQQSRTLRDRRLTPAPQGGSYLEASLADRLASITARLDAMDAGVGETSETVGGRLLIRPAPQPVTRDEVEALQRDLAAAGVADHSEATIPVAAEPDTTDTTTQGLTIRQVMDAHLAEMKLKHAAGERGGKSLRSRSWKFESICKWTPPSESVTIGNLPASRLDGKLLSTYHAHLMGTIGEGKWSPSYAGGHLIALKTLVRWAYVSEYIDTLPRNISSRHMAITTPETVVQTMTTTHITALLDAANKRTRAFTLLALNCGATAQDLADLTHDELDLQTGTLTRKRSKSQRARTNTPTVTWPLWASTVRAVKATMSDTGPLVFVSEQGRPLVHETVREDGRVSKSDAVRQAFDRLRKKLNPDNYKVIPPFKTLRATSANALRQHPEYGDVANLFLAHAASNVMDRHYAAPRNEKLARAVKWLGSELGVAKA